MTGVRCCGLLGFIGVGMMMVFCGVFSAAFAQNVESQLPVVSSASVPLYPHTALLAHIQGTVKIRATTDGSKVSALDAESGSPMLVQAAEDNIRTWQFEEHTPVTFVVTFHYTIEEPPQCGTGNAAVVLHMPSDVQVSAKGVHTCDPASTTQNAQHQ